MFEANRWSNVGVKDVLAAGTNFISGLWSGGPGAGHSLLTVRKFLRHEQYQDARDFFQANRSDFTQSMLEPNEWAILTSVEKAKKEEAVVEDDDVIGLLEQITEVLERVVSGLSRGRSRWTATPAVG